MTASGRYARGSVLSALMLTNLSSHTVSLARRKPRVRGASLGEAGFRGLCGPLTRPPKLKFFYLRIAREHLGCTRL